MSNDWDVIEELEFWDDYHAIYGPEPISRRKQKKINKYNKRKAKEKKIFFPNYTYLKLL